MLAYNVQMLSTSKIRIKLENVLDLDIIIDLSPHWADYQLRTMGEC